MLDLFSDRARLVVVQASEAARSLGHEFIGAEHLLLGLIAEKHGMAARALENVGVSGEAVRHELLARHPQGDRPTEGSLPFNAEGKSVLELARAESQRLGESRIGAEHVLLAVLKTEQQSAVALLEATGVDPERVRLEVMRLMVRRQSLLAEVDKTLRAWDTVAPDGHLRRLLMNAAELAVDCERSRIETADVVFAVAQDPNASGLLVELGVQVERVAELLERHRSSPGPPDLNGHE